MSSDKNKRIESGKWIFNNNDVIPNIGTVKVTKDKFSQVNEKNKIIMKKRTNKFKAKHLLISRCSFFSIFYNNNI